MYVCIYVYIYMYICIHIYVYIYTCICIHICVCYEYIVCILHIYIHINEYIVCTRDTEKAPGRGTDSDITRACTLLWTEGDRERERETENALKARECSRLI